MELSCSHLWTRLPKSEEIELFHEGQFQSVQLIDDTLWEPYSKEFAKREKATRVARSISVTQVTNPRPKPSPRHATEEEEKLLAEEHGVPLEAETEEDYKGSEESEMTLNYNLPRN